MKKVRWGVLSTARIAQTQVIPAMFRADNAEILAIASRSNKVHAIAVQLEIPRAFESYQELLLDPDIDAVYIPLPNHLHKEWVIKSAEAGKHVLCEKPASLTRDDVIEMISVCKKHNVKFMEAFMYQLHPQHARVKEIIGSGEIGEVKLVKSSHSFYLSDRMNDIRMDIEMGGGSLYDLGCYSINVIQFLSQSEPISIYAEADIDSRSGVDITAAVSMKLANGWLASFDCSFDMIGRNEYEVIGSKGTVRVPFAFRPDLQGGIGTVIVNTEDDLREEKISGDIYRMEIEQFSEVILADAQLPITNDSTIQNMNIIETCYRSICTGEKLEI